MLPTCASTLHASTAANRDADCEGLQAGPRYAPPRNKAASPVLHGVWPALADP